MSEFFHEICNLLLTKRGRSAAPRRYQLSDKLRTYASQIFYSVGMLRACARNINRGLLDRHRGHLCLYASQHMRVELNFHKICIFYIFIYLF